MIKDRLEGYSIRDKPLGMAEYVTHHLRELCSMFKYSNLPEYIPPDILELQLMINGTVGWVKHDGKLYALTGGYGGEVDAYRVPTLYTISNPYLKLSKNFVIGKECVVMKNDSMCQGMLPLIRRRASIHIEGEISLLVGLINSRIVTLLATCNDTSKVSAEKFIKRIEEGELSVMTDSQLLEGIKNLAQTNSSGSNRLSQIIEVIQYNKGCLYNDMGLSAPFNMKREYIGTEEASLNEDILLPLVDDMLTQRKSSLERINSMFDTDIEVTLSSAWGNRKKIINKDGAENVSNDS